MASMLSTFTASVETHALSYSQGQPLTSKPHAKPGAASKTRRAVVSCSMATPPSPQVSQATISAPAAEYTPETGASSMNLATAAVNALISFQPFFKFAAGKAREMMIKRGDMIGFPWEPALRELKKHDWDAEVAAVAADSRVPRQANGEYTYPEYYLKPFHAYENGNLSLDVALEFELAAKAVHAPLFDPERATLDPNGDANLRSSYHSCMKQLLRHTPSQIVDLGCASGLGSFALLRDFPGSHVTGVDLSPYFVAVARYNKQRVEEERGSPLPVSFLHAAAEDTQLPDGSVDLVSICLVCHELPRSATKEIIEEAHRILKPGGAFAVMEMNPRSPFLQKMVDNVFAFTAFKATEPYFDDYRTFPMEVAIAERGFEYPQQLENSPRHRTMVAYKK